MIEWKKDLPNGDICIPIEFEEIEGQGLRICALEEVRSAVLGWEVLHASDPFSDASLAFLWQALLPYFEKLLYSIP